MLEPLKASGPWWCRWTGGVQLRAELELHESRIIDETHDVCVRHYHVGEAGPAPHQRLSLSLYHNEAPLGRAPRFARIFLSICLVVANWYPPATKRNLCHGGVQHRGACCGISCCKQGVAAGAGFKNSTAV